MGLQQLLSKSVSLSDHSCLLFHCYYLSICKGVSQDCCIAGLPQKRRAQWCSLGSQGIKLYYRVLENMLKAEEARTGKRNFTALLNNKTFHKCLLACAFEMVIASYRMVSAFVRDTILRSAPRCDLQSAVDGPDVGCCHGSMSTSS